ncbi:outer membrane protein assembly factor BamB family protein [Haloarcula halophila]|uniref:outer membrane protein assembly factor BamB family protein n=1 Tax=Haloarcula TaxID=2237 RepID=UPI0023E35B40|nr:PQQ-binding-like beta-propeller repeat protein [Halomicroarcula sp. DFY41]
MPSTLRRTFLGTVVSGAVAGIAGCSSSCPDTDTPEPSHTVGTADGSAFETLPDGAWPSPRFDAANTGYTPVEFPSPTPSVQWRSSIPVSSGDETERLTSGPIVAEETVMVATKAGLFGLSLRDGTERWRRDLVPAAVESAHGYGQNLASPIVTDETVICPTADGVVALDIADGGSLWRADNVTGAGTPARTGEGVICPTTDGLTMVDTRDGSPRWTASVDARDPAVADDTILVGGEQTVALDAETGKRQWTVPTGTNEHAVVADGTVYLSTGDGLVGRALSDGSEQWRIDRGRFLTPPVVTPETIYAVESPGEAGDATFAFDRVADGKPTPRWCSQVGSGAVTAAADDGLLTLQSAGLVAFTADYGDATWRYPLRDGLQPPAVLDGGLVTVSTDGVVAALGGD